MTRSFEASVAQLVELHLAKVVVEGSNPFARSIFYGGVAQLVEQVTLNHWVHGSSPCTPTIKERQGNQKPPVLGGFLVLWSLFHGGMS